MAKVFLTDKLLRTLSSDQAQEDFWDENLPGLGVRVSRGGSRTFFFSYRSPRSGERVRLTLGGLNLYPAGVSRSADNPHK